ncbi:MAG TPA: hypothetical protein VK912_01840, partial [Longimicrobiales bacterium]|nr:hypothetical protein [Longimicrobiales bacterium]
QLLHLTRTRVPTLAIHPADLERGFWPRILRLTEDLLESGYEPATPTDLLHGGIAKPRSLTAPLETRDAEP